MKLLPITLLIFAAFFLTFSCETVDYAKKYPNMVANADPVSAGTFEVQFDRFLSSKVKKNEVEVIFYPRLNAVALEFRYELIQHRQFWDMEGRSKFAQAVELYKADYEARNLVDKYRKTRAAYGKVPVKVEWEAFKYNKTRFAYPTVEMGYCFKEGMPFFTTLMRSAREELEYEDNSQRTDSSQISIYFTRTQADELVKLFDQEFLMRLLDTTHSPQSGEQDEETETEPEPYREYDG